MNISDAFPSKYVKAEDLGGRDVTVTIKTCTLEDIILGEEPKPVLWFENASKGMVLNVTNARTLTKLYGPDTDAWAGRKIILRAEEVDFKGERVLGLRVSLSKPGEPQPAAQPSRSRSVQRPVFTEEPPVQKQPAPAVAPDDEDPDISIPF
jgi:hypothetical protein